jgi:alkyl sulfatase BDS1-like metallo-beta-lactamase superfamily hydrolase
MQSAKGLNLGMEPSMMLRKTLMSLVAMTTLLAAPAHAGDPASAATKAAQSALAKTLPFADRQDFDFASRGYMGTRSDPIIKRADGAVVWDLNAYSFVKGNAPDTVNPSLWRHDQVLAKSGLFQVSDTIWQVRGFDISNVTFIKGKTGWIVIDPLTSAEVAKAALELVNEKLGVRPIVAMIYTHSHGDHFGGVKGMIEQKDVDEGKVQVIAPQGFMEQAVSENIIAGTAMNRRATYQFGHFLAPGPQGQMGSGIGMAVSKGTVTLIAPTVLITHTGQEMVIDGVKVQFQITPGTEAPSEMNFFLPDLHILCMAENANVSMHNVLTPRGALVRDAKAWAEYLTESVRLYGANTDIMFTSHGWPRFGKAEVNGFLENHRDAYKFLHDQSVRYMNQGLTGEEIAAKVVLPKALNDSWYNKGYYGTMRFNSRAVYQRYMGWYDANPVHLADLPPAEEGKRYVAAMGGADKVMALAKLSIDSGDYSWAATLLNNVVMADSANVAAREMLASAYDQLGYQQESSLGRNIYLMGATELRKGVQKASSLPMSSDMVANLPTAMLFDLLSVRLDAAKAEGVNLKLAMVFPDRNESVYIRVRNGVLIAETGTAPGPVDATLTVARPLFLQSILMGTSLAPAVMTGKAKIEGDMAAFRKLTDLFDKGGGDFPIVTRP